MNNDVIRREIFIHSSIKNVWEAISRPAWWVGDAPGPDNVEVTGSRIVADTKYGKFPVLIEREEPPNYLVCRWSSSFPGEEPEKGNSTLVEFNLEEVDGGTWVRVIESGFASLPVSGEKQRKYRQGNAEGWESQLNVLREKTTE
ncbi:Uncharacterized conserved protein YndB, AHSA1/START domain [Halobacillus dabanensis]|uniref:Uncharacterized conserved protein YndB, AHSA1/START domain n=1 Tax=Halobacillus dabanensis TaxID=240302 RepID=A0A1I3YLD4_HALDA|nr:SRPBCC domain-containing protein [Halobacillus dabanensis]SFK32747.1 Uncharacterized conserved protein YndB, AHSA1/START domain [Halobacillus dabanensis]